MSTIDWIKEFCKVEYGIDPNDKSLVNRAKWHKEKMHHKNYVFKIICDEVDKLNNKYNTIFIHCREKEEIEKFVNKHNAIAVLIKRDCIKPANNFADMNVNDYKYDLVIENNKDIYDLEHSAEVFCRDLEI